ncbi:hypothetical protein CTAYLR_004606 [Chrysophaeum taylorii]|uniref:Autophagy protein 5 n=1 Tax=Chrysophaeum taylorii TaxID=2483200 RepID=A0AAD7UEE0_9STRA|nr:hypothetical protein CTAYLR_004606 [Chrysophaeum taylorii]
MDAVQEEVWLGSIPVCVELAGDEVVGAKAPRPYWAMVPRMSYLPTLAGALRTHFSDSIAQLSYRGGLKRVDEDSEGTEEEPGFSRVWFSAPEPLRWQRPAGVLYDACGGGSLPWRVVVHFSNYPRSLLDLEEDTCERTFFHALKQAVHLETGTARAALVMPRVQQSALWKAVASGDRAAFAAADVKNESPLEAPPRSVPVRLVLEAGKTVVQLPFSAYDSRGRKRTLGETLLDGDRLEFLTDASALRAHAVDLDPDLPLIDTWKALRHADHFLYVLVSHTQR